MVIKTLWGWRKSEDTPELMQAWDEYTVDNWPEGWTEACEKARASWGDDLYSHREIDLVVNLDSILQAFAPPKVPAMTKDNDD